MRIVRSKKFVDRFFQIVEYIARDKLKAAKSFKNSLNKEIENLKTFPYKYRKSYYFEDEDIRDMTFKGYTIVYRVDSKKRQIVLLDIFNQNKPL